MSKFDSDLDEQVYSMHPDHTFGDSIDGTWNGWIDSPFMGLDHDTDIVACWIIEDSQGFVAVEYARSPNEYIDMQSRWSSDLNDYIDRCDESGEQTDIF